MKVKTLKNRVYNAVNRIDRIGEEVWMKWLVFCIYTIAVILLAIYHEPWFDEYHAWHMVYSMNIGELWQAMRIEGHFCLYHLLLYPWVKYADMDYHALSLVTVPLMLIAAYLVIHRLRFPFIGKLLIIFSAPFLFSYPVVSRCYALIPPILAGLAVLYQQKKYPFIYCILLGLLANTHAYIEGLVAILWCSFVYNQIYKIYKTDSRWAKRNCLAASLTVLFVLFAFVQVAGGLLDVANDTNAIVSGKYQTEMEWMSMFYIGNHIALDDLLHRNLIPIIPKIDLLLTLCCYVMLIVSASRAITSDAINRSKAVMILFVGIAWQVLFASNIYGMNWQRIDLPYFVLVFTLWILSNVKRKYVYTCLLCCFLLNTGQLLTAKNLIYHYEYAHNLDTSNAKHIENMLPENAEVYYTKGVGFEELWKINYSEWTEDRKVSCECRNTLDCYVVTRGDTINVLGCRLDVLQYPDNIKLYHIIKP